MMICGEMRLAGLLSVALLSRCFGCTTFILGRRATMDGSVIATHSNDGGGTTDPRLIFVPAQDYAAEDKRPVYYSPENYPRYVGTSRNVPLYYKENCQAGSANCAEFEPLGFIPQVNHTFSYYEGTYGIMNEKQVGLAESTCSGVFVAKPVHMGGKALLSIDQLSQIAMERASTAREAVSIMGSLAEQYGFYGESDSFEGGSEALLVTDPVEAWVFHILADPTGASAIWVGARVPDDSVAVVANMFSIREVNLSDTANFLGRLDMWEIAEAHGLYKPGDKKDFTATFSDGEYSHKYYSGRRMWRVFDLLAPSKNLPSEYGNLKEDAPYPFAVPVDSAVSLEMVRQVMREWYEGTNYSTSQGIAGGPFGTPDRYSGGATYLVKGNWERTIALYRSSDSFIIQSQASFPEGLGGLIWFGPAAAHATCYVPVYSGLTAAPDALAYGWQGVYNRSTAFWAHRALLNVAQIKFSYMIQDIRTLQHDFEFAAEKLVHKLALIYAKREDKALVYWGLNAHIESVVQGFNRLIDVLLFKYADGDVNYWANGSFHSNAVGYPAWWLEEVGYSEGPPPPKMTKVLDQWMQRQKERHLQDARTTSTPLSLSALPADKMANSLKSGAFKQCLSVCHVQHRTVVESSKAFEDCITAQCFTSM